MAIIVDDSLGAKGLGSNRLGGLADLVGSGSGVVITDKVVLTNDHVVEHCDRMAISPGIPAKILARDKEHDLALLETGISAGSPVTLAASADIAATDTLYTGGYPGADSDFVITEGKLSDRALSREVEDYWLLTNRIDPGNSGGPLLGADGQLRGIVFASLPVTGIVKKSAPKGSKEGISIRLDTIKTFLGKHSVAYRVAEPAMTTAMTAAARETHTAAITVLVACFKR